MQRRTLITLLCLGIAVGGAGVVGGILLITQSDSMRATASTGFASTCNRSTPYEMPEEFKRALSLRKQRITEAMPQALPLPDFSYINCLNIQYAKIKDKGIEGIFLFDENSSLQEIKVYVDQSYKLNDDLLLALLLHHELTHVNQYIESKQNGTMQPCQESEINAYLSQLFFLKLLNTEELDSIILRWESFRSGEHTNSQSLSTFQMIDTLFKMADKGATQCTAGFTKGTNEWHMCVEIAETKHIENFVSNEPYYQQQCSKN